MVFPKVWQRYLRSTVINFNKKSLRLDNLKPKFGHNLNIYWWKWLCSIYANHGVRRVDLNEIMLSRKRVWYLLTFFRCWDEIGFDQWAIRINLKSIALAQVWDVYIFLTVKYINQRELMAQILFSNLDEYRQRCFLYFFCCIYYDLTFFGSFGDRLRRTLNTHFIISTLLQPRVLLNYVERLVF